MTLFPLKIINNECRFKTIYENFLDNIRKEVK